MSLKWEPIEKYDKMKNKPKDCIFFVEASLSERHPLYECFSLSRTMGFRTIKYYAKLNRPEKETK